MRARPSSHWYDWRCILIRSDLKARLRVCVMRSLESYDR